MNDLFNLFSFVFGLPPSLEKNSDLGIKKLYLGITNICNARCVFCGYKKIKSLDRREGIMSWRIFKKAIDDFSALGGGVVSLTPIVGEPLLDPGIIEKIHYAVLASNIESVYLFTNGILLSKGNLYKKIVNSGIDSITISTPGFDEQIFKKVYGSDDYFVMLSGVKALLAYNKSQGEPIKIILEFKSPINPSRALSSDDYIQQIKPFISERVYIKFLFDYDNWGGLVGKKDLLGVMRLKRTPKFKRWPCTENDNVAVLFDGAVRLCGCRLASSEHDELVVGNIKTASLEAILRGQEANSIKERFERGAAPTVCRRCSRYLSALPWRVK